MDILRANAKAEFANLDPTPGDNENKFAQRACESLTIVTGYSNATADNVELSYYTAKEDDLPKILGRRQLSNGTRPVGETLEQATPYLELVFLPPPVKRSDKFPKPKGFSITKKCFQTLFEHLGIDDSLLSYLTSSRSGWFCVRGQDGRHSFLYKDYMYTLSWTFNTQTRETRGMLAARSDFKRYSKLRDTEGNLGLPTLSKALLDQPLALAFIALADCVAYLEQIIEQDGYTLGDIEGKTGYGLWVKPEEETGKETRKQSANDNLEQLEVALRKIAKLIGKFLTLFKSVEISQSMAETIEQAIENPGRWGANEEPSPWDEAVQLLKARMHSVDQSGKATIHRAKAMSNVVSGLISRLVARRAVADGSSMKVIALMTMFFLPATFISALWAVPALDKDEALTKQNFGIYWVVTIPVTFVVFMAWWLLNNDAKMLERFKKMDIFPEKHVKCQKTRMQDTQGREPTDLEAGHPRTTATEQVQSPKHSNSNKSAKSS